MKLLVNIRYRENDNQYHLTIPKQAIHYMERHGFKPDKSKVAIDLLGCWEQDRWFRFISVQKRGERIDYYWISIPSSTVEEVNKQVQKKEPNIIKGAEVELDVNKEQDGTFVIQLEPWIPPPKLKHKKKSK